MGFPKNEDRNRELVRLHAEGTPRNVLCERYGLTRQRVHAIIQRWGPIYDGQAETENPGEQSEY